MKTILLLGFNNLVEEYAEEVLNVDIYKDLVHYPSPLSHYTEYIKYIDIIKEENPPVITTQSLEFIDELLSSDLDFDVITVKKFNDELKARILPKKEVISMMKVFKFDPRV